MDETTQRVRGLILADPALASKGPADAPGVHAALAGPKAGGTRPKLLYESLLFALLSPASLAKVAALAYLPAVSADIKAQDRPAVATWAALWALAGIIEPAEKDAILAALAETEPDTRSALGRAGLADPGVEVVRRALMGDS